MDRQKYVNSQDYRDGYDEGVEAGKYQMEKKIEYASNEIKKILSIFEDKERKAEGAAERSDSCTAAARNIG